MSYANFATAKKILLAYVGYAVTRKRKKINHQIQNAYFETVAAVEKNQFEL